MRFSGQKMGKLQGTSNFGIAVEERDGGKAPPSAALDGMNRRENAAERDRQRPGDAPAPPIGRVGHVGRAGRLGEGQQADDSKVGKDGTTERRVGVIMTAHRKKIFARFFRLQKIARGLEF